MVKRKKRDWEIYKLKLKAMMVAFLGSFISLFLLSYGFYKSNILLIILSIIGFVITGIYSKYIMFKYKRRSGYIIHQE